MNNFKEKLTKQVAALKYNPNSDSAPKILALGKGVIADKIIDKAKENHIPLVEDKNLAEVLNTLRIGDEIPQELYEVVAGILVFVSRLDKKYEKDYRKQSD